MRHASPPGNERHKIPGELLWRARAEAPDARPGTHGGTAYEIAARCAAGEIDPATNSASAPTWHLRPKSASSNDQARCLPRSSHFPASAAAPKKVVYQIRLTTSAACSTGIGDSCIASCAYQT